MLGFIKRGWSVSGVVATLNKAGVSKEAARAIAKSVPECSWPVLNDCTNGLNQQCSNLMNSVFAISVFEHTHNGTDFIFHDQLNSVATKLSDAVEYQEMMGNQAALAETQKRFEYAFDEKYFASLPVIVEDQKESCSDVSREEGSGIDLFGLSLAEQELVTRYANELSSQGFLLTGNINKWMITRGTMTSYKYSVEDIATAVRDFG